MKSFQQWKLKVANGWKCWYFGQKQQPAKSFFSTSSIFLKERHGILATTIKCHPATNNTQAFLTNFPFLDNISSNYPANTVQSKAAASIDLQPHLWQCNKMGYRVTYSRCPLCDGCWGTPATAAGNWWLRHPLDWRACSSSLLTGKTYTPAPEH